MGLWQFLFGRNEAITFKDGFFGEMLFMESVKDPADNYFECQRYFKPSGKNIELSVAGQMSGPTKQQKNFFVQVEDDYERLITKFAPAIEAQFGAWMTLPVIKDFKLEFEPTYLRIPTCNQLPVEWELTFDTIHDLNHIVTVGMRGNEPKYVRVDG